MGSTSVENVVSTYAFYNGDGGGNFECVVGTSCPI